jgi:hypothetical protein
MEHTLKFEDRVGHLIILRRLEATDDSELDVEGDEESVS